MARSKKKKGPKEHFYVSRSGAILSLSKLGEKWYLTGSPVAKDSKMLWPVGCSENFKKISKYVKNTLGLSPLR